MEEVENILRNITEVDFLPTQFRCYLGVKSRFLIQINPFSISVYDIDLVISNKNTLNENPLGLSGGFVRGSDGRVYTRHNKDYVSGKCEIDVCSTYELVSGDMIHHGQDDSDKMNLPKEYYKSNRNEIFNRMVTNSRNGKIDKLT